MSSPPMNHRFVWTFRYSAVSMPTPACHSLPNQNESTSEGVAPAVAASSVVRRPRVLPPTAKADRDVAAATTASIVYTSAVRFGVVRRARTTRDRPTGLDKTRGRVCVRATGAQDGLASDGLIGARGRFGDRRTCSSCWGASRNYKSRARVDVARLRHKDTLGNALQTACGAACRIAGPRLR